MLEAGDRVVQRDAAGRVRFRADLDGADRSPRRSGRRAEGASTTRRVAEVLEVYEAVFRHRRFTGRCGTMYGYEGLGCVYWHMVAKLLLAVQEQSLCGRRGGRRPAPVRRLADAYHGSARAWPGPRKTPAEYGAFPLDPYSHTPRHTARSQPGMTGQVKEEILTRFGELGVRVHGGRIRFWPLLLRASELLTRPATLEVLVVGGARETLSLQPGTLAFTLCQVPVVYRRSSAPALTVVEQRGPARGCAGDTLDEATSAEVFERTGRVRRIEVDVVTMYDA